MPKGKNTASKVVKDKKMDKAKKVQSKAKIAKDKSVSKKTAPAKGGVKEGERKKDEETDAIDLNGVHLFEKCCECSF